MGVFFALELAGVSIFKNKVSEVASDMSLDELTAVVVDDSEYSLSFIEEVTKMVGLNVHSFCCPLEALKYVRSNSVDMVCTDFNMPKMDGLTFIRETRRVHGDIPVVMITGEANAAELRERCRKDVVSSSC